jgi:hypothetical protein
MIGLIILFALLSILFGVWGFAVATAWVGLKVLFWICVILLILFFIGSLFGGRRVAP